MRTIFDLKKAGFTKKTNKEEEFKKRYPEISFDNIAISNSKFSKTNTIEVKFSLLGLSLENNEYASFNIDIIQCTDSDTSERLKKLATPQTGESFMNTLRRGILENKIQKRTISSNEYILTGTTASPPSSIVSFKNNDMENPDYLSILLFMSQTTENGQIDPLSIQGIYSQTIMNNFILTTSRNVSDLREGIYDDILDFTVASSPKITSEDYFSEIFQTIDASGFIKLMFFFDKDEFVLENSKYGTLLENNSNKSAKEKILLDSRISNIIIKRRKVKRTKKFQKQISNFDINDVEVDLISSADDLNGKLIEAVRFNVTNKEKNSELREATGIKSSSHKVFFVSDYEIKNFNSGKYQYGVSIEVEDGIHKYLLDSLTILENNLSVLEKYSITKKASKRIEDILGEFIDIITAIRKMDKVQIESLDSNLRSSIQTSLGVDKLIKLHSKMINKISLAIGRTRRDSNIKTETTRKSSPDRHIMNKNKYFNNYIDVQDLRNTHYNYLGMKSSLSVGVSGFSKEDIEDRFFKEFLKLIVYDGDREDLDFAAIREKIYKDNIQSAAESNIKINLFDMSKAYYSFLSPSMIGSQKIKEQNVSNWQNEEYNNSEFEGFNSIKDGALASSYYLQGLGVFIESENYFNDSPKSDTDYVESSDIFSELDNLVSENINMNNNVLQEESKTLAINVEKASPVLNSLSKFYYGTNSKKPTRESYDLQDPKNILQEGFEDKAETMPNHIRALFGAKSDLVRNQWYNTEVDYSSDPNSFNMMMENYNNLIIIECLKGFNKDLSGREEVMMPIFNSLTKEDLQNLGPEEYLFCRTRIYHNLSYKIGFKSEKNKKSTSYVDQYFVISLGNGKQAFNLLITN